MKQCATDKFKSDCELSKLTMVVEKTTAIVDSSRLHDIVISGLGVSSASDVTDQTELEKDEVAILFEAIGVGRDAMKSVKRLPGKKVTSNSLAKDSKSLSPSRKENGSLLLVSLADLISRDDVLAAAKKLKELRVTNDKFKDVILRPDLSKAQFEDLKNKQKLNNDKEIESGSLFRWYIRGSCVVRFRQYKNKKKQTESTTATIIL